jgi:hypothetical protein
VSPISTFEKLYWFSLNFIKLCRQKQI